MSEIKWEEIEVPRGRFIGWGKLGQSVTLRYFDLDPHGGKDFQGNPCPRLTGTLVEDAVNYRDLRSGNPTQEVIKAGEMVNIEGSTANLKKALLTLYAAQPSRDDLVRVTYNDTYETPEGPGKAFKVEHARGAAAEDSVSEDDL